MKISVIGTGAYSLAISLELAKKDNKIILWTENSKIKKYLKILKYLITWKKYYLKVI